MLSVSFKDPFIYQGYVATVMYKWKWSTGVMLLAERNLSTRKKYGPVPLCQSCVPHELLWGYSYNKNHRDALILKIILVKNSTCFGQIYCPSTGVLILYTQQEVLVIQVMLTVCQRGQDGSWPRWQTVNMTSMTNTYCCVYSTETPADGQ